MNDLPLYIYLKQQELNYFFNDNIYTTTWLSCSTILLGGILSSLSPCMISVLPLSIGYINSKKHPAIHSLIFIIGILTSITALGLCTIILKNSYAIFSNIGYILSPILMLILGLSLLNIVEIKLYVPSNISNNKNKINHWFSSYLIGISIGFNVSPCTTPILMTLITWISSTQQILTGIIFLLFYSIGYLAPIIISLISFNQIKQMNFINPLWNNVIPISGSMIIAGGTFSLLHQFLSEATI